ncbi:MAG: hypothetical protein C5B52_00365 [Bacteroidetes bacterium]|nr:MAG: hypothetical protein C5B52_00365 [Bacteroidota bacterium]
MRKTYFILGALLLLAISCGKPKPDPVITSFDPTEGSPGMAVTIRGIHFGNLESQTQIYFNRAVVTQITAVTDSVIIAFVPPDATTGKITVSIDGNTTTSANDFVVH